MIVPVSQLDAPEAEVLAVLAVLAVRHGRGSGYSGRTPSGTFWFVSVLATLSAPSVEKKKKNISQESYELLPPFFKEDSVFWKFKVQQAF